jgi:hypothetical protein
MKHLVKKAIESGIQNAVGLVVLIACGPELEKLKAGVAEANQSLDETIEGGLRGDVESLRDDVERLRKELARCVRERNSERLVSNQRIAGLEKDIADECSDKVKAERRIAELVEERIRTRGRLRWIAQTLIEVTGADGPQDAEAAASTAASQLVACRAERDRQREVVNRVADKMNMRAESAEIHGVAKLALNGFAKALRKAVEPTSKEKTDV